MSQAFSRVGLFRAVLVAVSVALLAWGVSLRAAEPQPLRFDMMPAELLGKAGQYVPLQGKPSIPDMPRDRLICFCLYTTGRGVLKLNAQLYPLREGEPRKVQLHIDRGEGFQQVAENEINPVGWSTVFRIEGWDDRSPAKYRVTHAGGSSYEGLIRRNPIDKEVIVVANLSCNSSTDRNPRPDVVANLKAIDADLLFFGGDQSYDHRDHLAAWLLFGRQFGEAIKDRPTVTIPDDHDVGHPNIWGAGGKKAERPDGTDGGYFMPVEYVNMVQRQQCGHLPDPHDPTPIDRGITVYYTSLNVGGIDFAILEDRKWKTGPFGVIPKMGPRPDHINDPAYDPARVDVPGAQLLGERQHRFLREWGVSWEGVTMKCVLSQSPFAGAAHLHGGKQDRLIADLDSNGWPQAARNAALREVRKSFAFMMSGDQHLATVIHHGVDEWRDSGWQFTSPSIWNLYGRAWVPLQKNDRPYPGSSLPYAGDFRDGFANRVTMAAYANPTKDNFQGTGFGVARFNKKTREIVMECWPRFLDVTRPGATQYPGWPLTITQEDNYARRAVAWLPTLRFSSPDPVVQVIDEADGEVLYTLRVRGDTWKPKVFRAGPHTVRVSADGKKWTQIKSLDVQDAQGKAELEVKT